MTKGRFTILTFAALALATSLAPAAADAQTVWDRIRDRAEQERDRDRRDRDDDYYRRDRRDDDYYGRGHRPGRTSDYERRRLRDLARRINDRSRDFQRDVDRLLDRSRYNGSRREDHINDDVRSFRNAAERFRDRAGSDNDLNRSAGEARELIETAQHVGGYLRRLRLDGRTYDDWMQIRADLRTVADIYGLRFNDYGGYYGGERPRGGGYGDRYPY